jgi:hypothetical protein
LTTEYITVQRNPGEIKAALRGEKGGKRAAKRGRKGGKKAALWRRKGGAFFCSTQPVENTNHFHQQQL